MAIVINGSGTLSGLAVGGLPDGTVDTDTLANTTVTAAKVAADVATQAEIDAKLNLAGGTLTGDLNFGDNVDANFGAGDDLKIHHDGSNSFITDGGTGNLNIRGENIIFQKADGSEKYMDLNADGAVELWHNNAIRLQTNATGIQLGMDGNLDGGIVSAVHSLFFNIDSDNNSSGQQIRFATNHNSGASGGNTLLSIKEDGRGLSQFTAKAWVNFNGDGTVAIRDSHNVSSITDNSTGNYNTEFTNNVDNTNFACVTSTRENETDNNMGASGVYKYNVSSAQVLCTNAANANPQDPVFFNVVVFGD